MRKAFLAGFACCVLTVPVACGDNRPAEVRLDVWDLSAQTAALTVQAGSTIPLRFVLSSLGGQAIAGERIDFAVIPEAMVAGATLAASSALTDAQGVATVTLHAGLPTGFEVTAQNPHTAISRVTITVVDTMTATIAVVPGFEAGFSPPRPVVAVELLQFQNLPCGSISWALPPANPVQGAPQVLTIGTPNPVRVDRTLQTALLGVGRDAGRTVRAAGCVDLAAGAVLQGADLDIALPLAAVVLAPASAYDISAHVLLATRNIATRIATPWLDLTDCPLDPSQLWLDCAIDALGSPAGATLDCVPGTSTDAAVTGGTLPGVPAAQVALLADIAGRRGDLAVGSACRPATRADGSPSLDAKLAALFPNPPQSPALDLESIGMFAAHVLDSFFLTSTLVLEATGAPNTFRGTHTLQDATFLIGSEPVTASILALGIPESQARFVDVTASAAGLTVAQHGLAVRLGTLARRAFEQAVSERLSLAPGIDVLLSAVFDLASSVQAPSAIPGAPASLTGCDALDALVCKDVGRDAGCMRAACQAGQTALGTRLAAGFTSANGDGTDLQWGGTVDMSDADGDGIAEALGPGPASTWTAQFRSSGPIESVTSELTATAR